jgi:NADH-quinone oxidoreductase subunit E
MGRDVKDTQPTDLAGAVNLFAHPVAGAAAWSAFGFGLASHAFGIWMGALVGTGNAAQRLLADAKSDVDGKAEADARATTSSRRQSPAKLRVVATQAAPAKRPAASVAAAPASKAEAVDDLKAIDGIGPKLEQVLNGLGVRSYAQIAAWTGKDIARIEDELGLEGRVARDDWTGQAAALARAGAKH